VPERKRIVKEVGRRGEIGGGIACSKPEPHAPNTGSTRGAEYTGGKLRARVVHEHLQVIGLF
jgi:hypothetical protein